MSEPNVFSPAFLNVIHEDDWLEEYPVSLEAGRWHGPWVVEPHEERWRVRREGYPKIEAELERRETALLLAAILPVAFLNPIYDVQQDEKKEDGLCWSLMSTWGDRGFCSIGHLDFGHDEIPNPLHVAHGLLTHPPSLAYLLLAAPPEVLSQVGELVARRCLARRP